MNNLIALHNFNREKLNDVLEKGYFICPSLAVTTKANCLANAEYGECTVIFKDEITDTSKNPNALLLSGDGYTSIVNYGAYDRPVEDVVEEMIEQYNKEENFMYRMGEDICKSFASVPITMEEARLEADRIISMDDYIDYKRNTLRDQYEEFLDKNFKGWEYGSQSGHVTMTPFLYKNSISLNVEIAVKAAIKACSKEIDLADKKKTVKAACKKYGLKVTTKKVDAIIEYTEKMRKAPIVYFEEKLFQAVYNKDIKGIVVPYNLAPELMEKLVASNIPFITYKDSKTREQAILDMATGKIQEITTERKDNIMDNNLTKAQKEYFKDSQIRNEQGQLMVCYHGSRSKEDFQSFGNIKIEPGYWFTADKEYAAQHGEKIIEAYLNVKKPYNLEDLSIDLTSDVQKCFPGRDLSCWDDKIVFNKEFGDYLKSQGYDGMMWKHSGEWTVVAFESNQIKSIDNLYPTKSDNFRDNSREYLSEHLKDMSMDECMKLTKHIKEQEKNQKESENKRDIRDKNER